MFGLSPETSKKLLLSVGTHHSERLLTPLEAAAAMRLALSNGATQKELASRLHFDGPTMVSRFVKLLSLAPSVQPLVGWGSDASTISFSSAFEIARLPEREQQVAAEAVLANQLGLSEVKQLLQIRQRSGKAIDEAVQAVIAQRPTIEVRHVIVGAITIEDVRGKVTNISQEERNSLLRGALLRRPELDVRGAKLGLDTFTLVGDKQLRAAMENLPKGFEAAISQSLYDELNKG